MSGVEVVPLVSAGWTVFWFGVIVVVFAVVLHGAMAVMRWLAMGGDLLDFLPVLGREEPKPVEDMDGECQTCSKLLDEHYRWWVRHEFVPPIIWATPTAPPEDLDELPKARW